MVCALHSPSKHGNKLSDKFSDGNVHPERNNGDQNSRDTWLHVSFVHFTSFIPIIKPFGLFLYRTRGFIQVTSKQRSFLVPVAQRSQAVDSGLVSLQVEPSAQGRGRVWPDAFLWLHLGVCCTSCCRVRLRGPLCSWEDALTLPATVSVGFHQQHWHL